MSYLHRLTSEMMIQESGVDGFAVGEGDYPQILVQLNYINPMPDIAVFLHFNSQWPHKSL
jgi:hypothetical protein